MRMKFLILSVAIVLGIAPALAADVTVTLNGQEQQMLRQMCEAAQWANRMLFTEVCSYFDQKLKTAAIPPPPVTPAPEPEK